MLRNIFLISLTLILFNGKNIFGSDNPPLDSIDVQAVLEKKVPDCKIRNFFIEKKDFQKFAEDIKAFCSTPNKNPLICHMIAYEIEKACQLPNEPDQRPTPAHYDLQIKSSEVCGKNRVLMTSKWILNKLSTNLQTKIPIEPKDLCTQVTTDQDTIRITRFFYHIAARVRSADSTDKNNKGDEQTAAGSKSNKESGSNNDGKGQENMSETGTTKSADAAPSVKKTDAVAEKSADTDKISSTTVAGKDQTSSTAASTKDSTTKAIQSEQNPANTTTPSANQNKDTTTLATTVKSGAEQVPQGQKNDGTTTQAIVGDKNNANVQQSKTNPSTTSSIDNNKTTKLEDNTTQAAQSKTDTTKAQSVLDVNKPKEDEGQSKPEEDDDKDEDAENKQPTPSTTPEAKPNPPVKTTDKVEEADAQKSSTTIVTEAPNDPNPIDTNDDTEKTTKKTDALPAGDKKDEEEKPINGDPNSPKEEEDIDGKNDKPDEDIEDNQNNSDEKNEETINNNLAPEEEADGDQVNADDLKPPTGQKTKPDQEEKIPDNSASRRLPPLAKPSNRYQDDQEGWSGSFVTYFLVFTLFIVIAYLILHNKNKVLGLMIEGCKRDRSSHGRRTGGTSSARYHRLSQSS